MSDTNTHSDEQELIKLFIGFLRFGEDLALKDSTKEKQLRDALMKDLEDGIHTMYHVVPEEFYAQMREQMLAKEIPCLMTKTPTGDYLFLVGSNHAEEFEQIQYDVMSKSTSFARQCTAEEMVQRSVRLGESKLVSISFEDEEMSSIFQQELYDNRIVCAVLNFEQDGTSKAYVDPGDMVRDSGKDLVGAELRQAMYQATGDFNRDSLDLKKSQAKYDREMVEQFSKAVAEGKDCVLGNADQIRDSAYLTCRNGEVSYHFMDGDGNHRETKLNIDKTMTKAQIQAMISRNALGIRDKVIYHNVQEWRTASPEKIKQNILDSHVSLRPTVENCNARFRQQAVDKTLNKFAACARKGEECVFGDWFNTKNATYLSTKDGEAFLHIPGQEPEQIDLSGCDTRDKITERLRQAIGNDFISNPSLCRDIEAWETLSAEEINGMLEITPIKQIKDISKDMETNMQKALEAVSKEASLAAKAASRGGKAKGYEVYQAKKEEVSKYLLNIDRVLDKYGIDKSFLDRSVDTGSESFMTGRDWLNQILEHYENTQEMSKEECSVKVEDLDEYTMNRVKEEQERADGRDQEQKGQDDRETDEKDREDQDDRNFDAE